jgi:hypothetical protein
MDPALTHRRHRPLGGGLSSLFPPDRGGGHWLGVSPFQLEVGMADLAIGATACVSFWRSLDFKAAAVMVNAIFLLGDAFGHVKQMIVAGNFAPGNAGVPFYSDIAFPLLAIILLVIVRRSEAAPRLS